MESTRRAHTQHISNSTSQPSTARKNKNAQPRTTFSGGVEDVARVKYGSFCFANAFILLSTFPYNKKHTHDTYIKPRKENNALFESYI
jgi:hypothetical protein